MQYVITLLEILTHLAGSIVTSRIQEKEASFRSLRLNGLLSQLQLHVEAGLADTASNMLRVLAHYPVGSIRALPIFDH